MEKFLSNIQKHILVVRRGRNFGEAMTKKMLEVTDFSHTEERRKELQKELKEKFGIVISGMTKVTFDKNGKIETETTYEYEQ